MCCFFIYDGRPFNIHGSIKASTGVILLSGSQMKNFFTKFMNYSSSQELKISYRDLELGLLIFPFVFGLILIRFPSKNLLDRDPLSIIVDGGAPRTSINISICSCSF
jgi:hypothetical protein